MIGFDPAGLVRDYGSIDAEAEACRRRCAVFDFSFVARARVSGPGALAAIGALTDRGLADLPPGRIRYALRRTPEGFLLSDLTVWNLDGRSYEVMSGRAEDLRDLAAATPRGTAFEDLAGDSGILALQGPRSLDALAGLGDVDRIAGIPYFGHLGTEIAGLPCRIGRLGYTGEPGFEIVLPQAGRETLWDALVQRARPAGFAAADRLRIEAGFVLFANEFRVAVTAGEAGLDRFAGAPAGSPRVKLVCFRATTRERPVLWRPPAEARLPERRGQITVTSACHSPAAGGTLGLGYVPAADARPGAALADPSGVFHEVRVAPLPFYDPGKGRPRSPWTLVDSSRHRPISS